MNLSQEYIIPGSISPEQRYTVPNIYNSTYNSPYTPRSSGNPLQGLLNNPNLTNALLAGGAAALGRSIIPGPWGGAIGGGAVPVVQSLLTPQQESWGPVLTQAALNALGGGVGGQFLGPLGAGGGAALAGYFGPQITQKIAPQLAYDGVPQGSFNGIPQGNLNGVPQGSFNGTSGNQSIVILPMLLVPTNIPNIPNYY